MLSISKVEIYSSVVVSLEDENQMSESRRSLEALTVVTEVKRKRTNNLMTA